MKPTYFTPVLAGIFLLSCAMLMSCKKKEGCTDPTATNYDPDATKNCCCEYPTPVPPVEFTFNLTSGTTPTQDGIIGTTEWSDALSANLYIVSGSNPSFVYGKVYVKHDSTALWVAFDIYDTTHNIDDFGDRTLVYIDKDYDRAANPQLDDFFCVLRRMDTTNSYVFQAQGLSTNNGNASDWSTYSPMGTWTAVMANVGSGAGSSWTVEYKIPYADIGVVRGTPKTIGINFGTTDAFSIWPAWVNDPNGTNWLHPNTWGKISSSDNWN